VTDALKRCSSAAGDPLTIAFHDRWLGAFAAFNCEV